MKKRIFNIMLAFCLSISMLPAKIETRAVENTKEKNKYGYVDSGIKIYEQPSNFVKDTGNLPVRFDLREENGVTSVKNQNPYSTCWAFSTMASVESNFKYTTGKEVDLSEINLSLNRVGVDGIKVGGNFIMATSYLANGSGPVLEKDDPYPTNGESPVFRNAQPTYNVMNSLYLPSRKNSLDNDKIKEAIINNGAVGISYFNSYDCLAKDNVSYYYNNGKSTNHAVALVGWDDNYPKEKFASTPPGNGAFIVKNSWGNNWGENGYFYISYYDTSLGGDLILTTNNTEWVKNVDNKYTYGKYSISYYYPDTSSASDKFIADLNVAKNNELLCTLSLYTFSSNASYEIYIDEDYKESNYPNGDVSYILNKKRKCGTLEYAGLNNIKLDNPVEVQAGKRFMVAVKYKDVVIASLDRNEKENNCFTIYNNKLNKRTVGSNPLTVYSYNKNLESANGINVDKKSLSLKIGEKSQIGATLVGNTYNGKKLKWTSSNPKVAVVDEDGLVTGRGNGSATITVSNRSGSVKNTVNVSINTNISVIKEFSSIDKYEKCIAFDDVITAGLDFSKIKLTDPDGNTIPIITRVDNRNLYIKVTSKYLGYAKLFIPQNSVKNKVNRGLNSDKGLEISVNSYDVNDKIVLGSKDIMKAIAEQLDKPESEITTGDISTLYYLKLYCDNVNLKDIGLLTSLESLNVRSSGDVKNIEDLKLLKNLEYVNFDNVNMANLDCLVNNDNLGTVIMYNCKMISLKGIEKLKNISFAYFHNNYISDIKGIEKLNKLKILELNDNQLTDISALANCTELADLNISNNKIVSLNGIQNLTKLESIYASGNRISNLKEIEKCTSLNFMNFNDNEIVDLTPIKTQSESKQNIEQSNLYISNNNIKIDDPIIKYLKDTKGWRIDNDEQKAELYEVNGFRVSENVANSKNDFVLTFNKEVNKDWKIEFYKCDKDNNRIDLPFHIKGNDIDIENKLYLDGEKGKSIIYCNIEYIDGNGVNQTLSKSININETGFYTEDINKDKTVDIIDLAEVASHYNKTAKGEIENWQYDKDINLDGIIDIYDLVGIARAM